MNHLSQKYKKKKSAVRFQLATQRSLLRTSILRSGATLAANDRQSKQSCGMLSILGNETLQKRKIIIMWCICMHNTGTTSLTLVTLAKYLINATNEKVKQWSNVMENFFVSILIYKFSIVFFSDIRNRHLGPYRSLILKKMAPKIFHY